jgi:hypothetical protein
MMMTMMMLTTCTGEWRHGHFSGHGVVQSSGSAVVVFAMLMLLLLLLVVMLMMTRTTSAIEL